MFVVPLAVPTRDCQRRHVVAPQRFVRVATPAFQGDQRCLQLGLLTWLVVGVLILASVPSTRDNAQFGATLPFWLLFAPVIDFLWLKRARWLSVLRRRAKPRRSLRPWRAAHRSPRKMATTSRRRAAH